MSILSTLTKPFRALGHVLKKQWQQPETRYAWVLAGAVGAGLSFWTPLPYLAIGGIAVSSFVASYFSVVVGKELFSLYRQFRDFMTHTDETVMNVNRRVSEAEASLKKVEGILEHAEASMKRVDNILEKADDVAKTAKTAIDTIHDQSVPETMAKVGHILEHVEGVATTVKTAIDTISEQRVPEAMTHMSEVKTELLKNIQVITPLLLEGKALLDVIRTTIEMLKAQQIPDAVKQLTELRDTVLPSLQKIPSLMQSAEKTLTTTDVAMTKLHESEIPLVIAQIKALNEQLTETLASVTKEVTLTTKSARAALNKAPALAAKLDGLLNSAQVTVEGITPRVDEVVGKVNGTMQEVHSALGGVNTGIRTVGTFTAPVTALASGLRSVGGWLGGGTSSTTTPGTGRVLEPEKEQVAEEDDPIEEEVDSTPAVSSDAVPAAAVPQRKRRR